MLINENTTVLFLISSLAVVCALIVLAYVFLEVKENITKD